MKAILFDMDDTLYDLAMPFYHAYIDLFGKDTNIPLDKLFMANRKHGDEVFAKSQSGEISEQEMYVYRIQKALADFDIKISSQKALEFQGRYVYHQSHIELSDRIKNMLSICKNKVALGIITNGYSAHQWNKINTLKLPKYIPQKNIFVSGDVGVIKPQVKIFHHACNVMEITPEEAYFVGDSFENDIAGAKNAGFHTVWFHRRECSISDTTQADITVTTEKELCDLIVSKI